MPKTHSNWTVLPHEPVLELAENLRWVRGSVPGMSLKRTMTVVRLADGRLLFHSPIALDEPSMQALESWGTPAFVIVPNRYHRLDAPAYKRRYPQMKVYGPRGSREEIEKEIGLDGVYEDFPVSDRVRFETLQPLADREGAMIVTSNDGVSIVLGDSVMNMDRKRDVLGFLFTTILGSAPGPRVSRLARLAVVKDKPGFRAELERFARTPNLARLIVGHDKVAEREDARAALTKAATYL